MAWLVITAGMMMYSLEAELILVQAKCMRYVPPNAVATINTVIYLLSLFSCVYFSPRRTLLRVLREKFSNKKFTQNFPQSLYPTLAPLPWKIINYFPAIFFYFVFETYML